MTKILIAAVLILAQAPEAARFEVASIKRNRSVDNGIGGGGLGRGDTYRVTNITVRTLLAQCYSNRFILSEIVGGPDWLGVDKFDIVAKTSAGRATLAMVLALLTDRLKLRTHEDMREQDVYRLVTDRPDRRLGPKLAVSTIDQAADLKLPPGERRCRRSFTPGQFDGRCVSLDLLLSMTLHSAAQRRVIDETGLTGTFDIDLTWDPTFEGPPDQRVPSDAPSIFTAVREQLGLRLEPAKRRVPVLVIDSVEPPAED